MTDKLLQLSWTPFAMEQLDDIYEYIVYKTKSADVALKFVKAVFEKTIN